MTKLNADGSALVYATYLGGNNYDYGNGIALDDAGNPFVVGRTSSSNFPVTSGALQMTFGHGATGNAFIARFAMSAP